MLFSLFVGNESWGLTDFPEMSLSQIDIYVKKEFLCKWDYAKATTGDKAQGTAIR